MGVYIKNWSLADWKELLMWAKIGANNAMIGEFAEVEEIPAHGRLIDADALRAEFQEPNEENGGWRNPDEALVHKTGVWAAIDTAPTIIPAEEGET